MQGDIFMVDLPPITEIAIEEPKSSVRLASLFLMFHRSGVEIATALASNRHTYLVTALQREQQQENRKPASERDPCAQLQGKFNG